MTLKFFKYQATGNDFIMVDNRQAVFPENNPSLINRLCHRQFGIGADGIILIEESATTDFTMIYYNPDGSQSFCGNGSRAAVHFANSLGLFADRGDFQAIDGVHQAKIADGLVEVKMADVAPGKAMLNGIFFDTGSPHYIDFVEDVDHTDVVATGRSLRYHDTFKPAGSNINFVQLLGPGEIKVRTYERGVENETLSCGTGVTAAAIAAAGKGWGNNLKITTPGGSLRVWFTEQDGGYSDVWLAGPAHPVFAGEITI